MQHGAHPHGADLVRAGEPLAKDLHDGLSEALVIRFPLELVPRPRLSFGGKVQIMSLAQMVGLRTLFKGQRQTLLVAQGELRVQSPIDSEKDRHSQYWHCAFRFPGIWRHDNCCFILNSTCYYVRTSRQKIAILLSSAVYFSLFALQYWLGHILVVLVSQLIYSHESEHYRITKMTS